MSDGTTRSVRRGAGCLIAMGVLMSAGSAAWADSGPVGGCAKDSENSSLWKRLSQSYQKHLIPGDQTSTSDPAAPAPAPDPNASFDAEIADYRQDVPPPPVSNPPWPYSVWNEGATNLIGYENMYSSALMDAIYCGPSGKAWKDSRVTIYGWIEPGANISTSSLGFNKLSGTGGNFPAAYAVQPNTVELDQVALYFERTPDEIQRDHFDWGFRVAGIYARANRYADTAALFQALGGSVAPFAAAPVAVTH